MEPVRFASPSRGPFAEPMLTSEVITKMHRNPPSWWQRPRRTIDVHVVAQPIRMIRPRANVTVTRLLFALGQRPDQDEDGEWYE